MAKRKIIKKQFQRQQQKQSSNIVIKIDNVGKKPRRSRPRKSKIVQDGPTRQLPPVVYQTLPQLTYYSTPDAAGRISGMPPPSMVATPKPATTILEDIGSVGTEGLVKILELPTKRETLSELISPVIKKTPSPEPRSPLVVQMEKQPERQIQKPQVSKILQTPQPESSISEPSMISGKTIFNERPEEPSMGSPFMGSKMQQEQSRASIPSSKIMQPPAMNQMLPEKRGIQPAIRDVSEPPPSNKSVRIGKKVRVYQTESGKFSTKKQLPTSEFVSQGAMMESQPLIIQKTQPQSKSAGMIISKPQEMQRDIFPQKPRQEPTLLEMPASQPSIVSYPRASQAAIMAPLPSELDVRARAGKQGGIFSKKMSREQKIEAYASFAGIPKSEIIPEQIDELISQKKREYQLIKKRESRERIAKELPAGFL
jgi:hypothetical protein